MERFTQCYVCFALLFLPSGECKEGAPFQHRDKFLLWVLTSWKPKAGQRNHRTTQPPCSEHRAELSVDVVTSNWLLRHNFMYLFFLLTPRSVRAVRRMKISVWHSRYTGCDGVAGAWLVHGWCMGGWVLQGSGGPCIGGDVQAGVCIRENVQALSQLALCPCVWVPCYCLCWCWWWCSCCCCWC